MKIPKAKRLPSGSWNIGLMVEGRRMSITAPTEKECVAKAAAVKAGLEEAKGREEKVTVDEAIRRYMEAGSAVSPPPPCGDTASSGATGSRASWAGTCGR